MFHAQLRERRRYQIDQFGRGNTNHLRPRASGIRQRAEKIEDRAHSNLLARRRCMARRSVCRPRKKEADPNLTNRLAEMLHGKIDSYAQRLNYICGTAARV